MSKDYPCVYWNDGKCKKFSDDNITSWCVWNPCDSQTPANADRIRAMSDEELNDLFNEIYNAGVEDAVSYEWGQRTNSFEWTMEWLQQPAEEDDNETVGERKDGND